MKLIDLHKRYIEWWQRKLGISDYALLRLVFFKTVINSKTYSGCSRPYSGGMRHFAWKVHAILS